jgi:fatty-acyl-CoA synthase
MSEESAGPDPTPEFTPAPPVNEWVGDWSARRRRLSPGRVGLVDATTGEAYTYTALDRRGNQTARLCREYGVEQGDRVAVLSRNRPELVDLFFATGKIGGVLAPLSHRLAPPELAVMLTDVDPRLLVVGAPFVDLATDVLAHEDCGVDPEIVVVAEDEPAAEQLTTAPRWTDARPADDSPVERPDVSMDDPHLFLHTGGSTGVPKETVIPHRSVLWNSFNTITAWGLRPADTTPMTFPMFHTGGWNVITVPLFHLGGTVVIAREFDPGQVLGLIEEWDATVLIAVPAVLRAMTDHDAWPETDLSTLRFAKSGGGPCRNAVLESWWDRGVDLSQGYGLTECGPNNFAMPDDWPREKADSVGVPAMHVDARVVDDDGDPLAQGAVGELELSGPHAADRYWRTPAESVETFGPAERTEASDSTERTEASDSTGRAEASDSTERAAMSDSTERAAMSGTGENTATAGSDAADSDTRRRSWVSTGDLARVDEDGYYHIEGRKKNMFVSGGENVYPPEVEDAIADHPAVSDVVVIGVPDERWGTVGRAVIEGDTSLELPELRSFLDDRLARFKHPRSLRFVEELPTSGPSKIDREAVRSRFGGQ